jgi:predicted nucleic acid-binding Zn ribbon protein
VITIDLICEVCGTSNPPGTEFCTNCNSYLAWDRSVLAKPSGQPSKPAAAPSNHSTQPTQKEWRPSHRLRMWDQLIRRTRAGLCRSGYGGQGYYDGRYNQGGYQGGYYPGGAAGSASTLEQPAYTDMSCPSCGTINPGTRRFCTHCGYAFFYKRGRPVRRLLRVLS